LAKYGFEKQVVQHTSTGRLSAGLQTGQTAGTLSDSWRSCVKDSAGS